jgi:hypothetical protein
MSKKIVFLSLFIVIAVGGSYFAKEYFKDRLDLYKADLSLKNKTKQLSDFFVKHDKESVYVELILTPRQNVEFNKSIQNSPNFHIKSLSNKKFEYIFHIREDGKREFVYDVKTKELKGIFMPHIQKTEEGITIINLLPLTPNEVKKIK